MICGPWVLLAEEVEPVLVLGARLHHYSFDVVGITDKSHLLRIERLLFVDFTGLNGEALGLDVHSTASTLIVRDRVVRCTYASLRRLLLSDAHILGLHHVRGHAQSFLVVRHSADGADLRLLDAHHVQRLFRRHRVVDIVVCCLLSTEIGVVIIQCVEHLAKCLVQPRVRLVHAPALGVMRDGLLPHLLAVPLHGRVVHMVLLDHVGQLFSLEVVGHGTCNLPFLN